MGCDNIPYVISNDWGGIIMQKTIILLGVIFIIIGVLYPFIMKLGVGRFPGDIYIKKGNFTFYFPIVTCVVISAVLSLLMWLMHK